jgi:hypothetical protein
LRLELYVAEERDESHHDADNHLACAAGDDERQDADQVELAHELAQYQQRAQ